jgi:ketosteroid isomerase-like protein
MGAPHSPAATVEQFSKLLSEGHIEALLELYEAEAAFAVEPGRTVVGTAAIREALERFVALRPRMSGTVENVIEVGDTALVVNSWRLEGRAPDGDLVQMAGKSADVLRRRADGSWGVLIDDPWGAEARAA